MASQKFFGLVALLAAAVAPLAAADGYICLTDGAPPKSKSCAAAFHELWRDLTGCDGKSLIPHGTPSKVGHKDSVNGCEAYVFSSAAKGQNIESAVLLAAFDNAWGACPGSWGASIVSSQGWQAGFRPAEGGSTGPSLAGLLPAVAARGSSIGGSIGGDGSIVIINSTASTRRRNISVHGSQPFLKTRAACGNTPTLHNFAHCALKGLSQFERFAAVVLPADKLKSIATKFTDAIESSDPPLEISFEIVLQTTPTPWTAKLSLVDLGDPGEDWHSLNDILTGRKVMIAELGNVINYMLQETWQWTVRGIADLHGGSNAAEMSLEIYNLPPFSAS